MRTTKFYPKALVPLVSHQSCQPLCQIEASVSSQSSKQCLLPSAPCLVSALHNLDQLFGNCQTVKKPHALANRYSYSETL